MRIGIGVFFWVICSACWIAPAQAGDLSWYRWRDGGEIPFGGHIDEIRAVKVIASEDSTDRRIIYGDRHGVLHALRFEDGRFQEEWKGQFHTSAVSEIFVADINVDGKLEIVVYSRKGHIAFYGADDYRLIWESREDEYYTISAMVVVNVDDDPQLELLFLGEVVDDNTNDLIPRLFIYDCLNFFEERRNEENLVAQSLVVADLDRDGTLEIALNTGPVLDMHSLHVEWHFSGCDRIGYADVNNDGTPDLIGEVGSLTSDRFLRVFDIRQNYRAVHGADVETRLASCAVCHGVVTDCAPCHEGKDVTIPEGFHGGGRKQESATHDVDPKGRVQECVTCHRAELEALCVDCHQKALTGVDSEAEAQQVRNGLLETFQAMELLRER